MDDVVNRFARELADAIAAAVAENPQVEACREKARAAGFEMKVTLEAVVGFVNRSQAGALAKVTTPARVVAAASLVRGHRQRPPVPSLAADRRRRDRRTGRIADATPRLTCIRAGLLTRAGSSCFMAAGFVALALRSALVRDSRRARRGGRRRRGSPR